MKNLIANFIVCLCLLFVSTNLYAQYLETFSLSNKGILSGPCGLVSTSCEFNDFTDVDWTIIGDNLTNIEAGDFVFSDGSSLMFSNVDEETCWESPVLDISSLSSDFSFSLDLSWIGFDIADYINVEYKIDVGSWIKVLNVVGGGSNTIQFLSANNYGDTTVIQSSLSGNSSFSIRVCVDANIASEIVTLDNVSVPEIVIDTNNSPTLGADIVQIQVCQNSLSALDLSLYDISDLDGDSVLLTLNLSQGQISSVDGNGLSNGVTISNSDSDSMNLQASTADLNNYLDSISNITFFTTSSDLSDTTFVIITISDGQINGISDTIRIISALPSTQTDTQTACDSYTWIDGNTYTESSDSATFTLTNINGCDSVVTLDLTINNSNSGTDTQTACDSYTWIDGNTYTESSDSATFTLTNINGCDSIITLDLSIDSIDVSTSVDANIITSNSDNSSYQWLDCNNNYSKLEGEINQSYTAVNNGSFAVMVSNSECSDTSDCININSNFIIDQTNSFLIYPNPTAGLFYIDIGNNKDISVQIFNPLGQLISEENLEGKQKYQLKIDGVSGLYLLKVKYKYQEQCYRIIKK